MFKIDVGICPKCGTDMEIRATIHDSDSIKRYLRGIGLSEHPPPIAPARYQQEDFASLHDEVRQMPDEMQQPPDYPE